MDIIPYARQVYNSDWLAADWYLNLNIPYRYLFSYVVGFFTEHFGTIPTIYVGRIISYIIFSVSFIELAKALKINYYLHYFAFIIYLKAFQYGIGDAGEWIIGGLETKVFSYSFAIISLASFLKERFIRGWIFGGLALSLHLLIGGYHLICLTPIFIIQSLENKGYLLNILKTSVWFILFGSLGLFAIYQQLFSSLNKEIVQQGWDIYVNIRVPHHTIPNFSIKTWIILIFLIFSTLLFINSKIKENRLLAFYGLASFDLIIIGFIVFYFAESHYLRYYFFRFSDVILPLVAVLLLSSFISNRFFLEGSIGLSKKTTYLSVAMTLVMLLHFKEIKNLFTSSNFNSTVVVNKTNTDVKLTKWIKENTSKEDIFTIPPYEDFFYINTERSSFVSWKHSPQNPNDIIEWYNRFKLLNNNNDFSNRDNVSRGYPQITDSSINELIRNYPEVSYIILPHYSKLNKKVVFKGEKYLLYRAK